MFSDIHLELFLETRKNDQYREGHWIAVAAISDSPACPVRLVKTLVARVGLDGHRPLFSAVPAGTRDPSLYGSAPISYSNMRAGMLAAFESIGLDSRLFGTHSCRSGGATLAAACSVPDRLWMEHGGWKSSRAAVGYVKTGLAKKLSVTQTMFSSDFACP